MLSCVPAASAEVGNLLWTRQGGLWFTEPASNRIGEITPGDTVKWFKLPDIGEEAAGGLAIGADGATWFSAHAADEVGRINANSTVTTFSVPAPRAKSTEVCPFVVVPPCLAPHELPGPSSMTAGSDGNIWFADTTGESIAAAAYGARIDRITPDGAVTEYEVPSQNSLPNDIVPGPDGNVWFSEATLHGGAIGRVTPSGTITIFPLPEPKEGVNETFGIAAGRDNTLWFTDQVRGGKPWIGRIGTITPTGAIRFFSVPTQESEPGSIALGTDGDMWFTSGPTKPGLASTIGRIAPSGTAVEFAIHGVPTEIVAGPNNEMLFPLVTAKHSDTIGRITHDGKVSYELLPSPQSCFTPRLHGKTLQAAASLLTRANCELGKVTKTSGSRRLTVVAQTPAPGATLRGGARVALQLR